MRVRRDRQEMQGDTFADQDIVKLTLTKKHVLRLRQLGRQAAAEVVGIDDLAKALLYAFLLGDLFADELVQATNGQPGAALMLIQVIVGDVGEIGTVIKHPDAQKAWVLR